MTTPASKYGSGLFAKDAPNFPHLAQGSHGQSGEIADLRRDVAKSLAPLYTRTVEQMTAPPAATAAVILNAVAPGVATTSYTYSSLTGTTGSAKMAVPRNVRVTTSGVTPAHAPTSIVVSGVDVNGDAISETLTPAAVAGYVDGAKCFSKVTSVVLGAGNGGVDCLIDVGIGAVLGLSQLPISLAGLATAAPDIEVMDGAAIAPVTGVFTSPATNAPNGAYTPATAPNGAHNYAIVYPYDASLVADA
jgi:hypothetical protein